MERLYPGMIENFKKYRSVAEPLLDELGHEIKNRANIIIPYPWAIVESALPRLAGKLPRVRIFPRKEVDRAKVEIKQDYIYYMMDRMNFLQLQTLWIRQYEIYGWSPLYVYWREEDRNMLVRKQVGPEQWALVKEPVKMFDDLWARVLDVFDCFLQPGSTDMNDCDWFMFREFLNKKDIEQRVKQGLMYPEVLQFLKDNKARYQPPDGSGRTERDDLIGADKTGTKYAAGSYEVLYTLEDDRTICMINRKILAAVGDNPNPLQIKSVIPCNLTPMINEAIGMGTIESLAGLPDKMNAINNANLDGLSFALGPVIIANRALNQDWENFVLDPGNICLVDGEISDKNLKFLEYPDTSIIAERAIMQTKEEMQFVSGVSDYITGVKSSARLADTATGVSTIVREANARYALKQAAFEAGSLRQFVKFADAYTQVYMTDERRIYVVGPQGYVQRNVTPEDIAYEADIIIEPGSSAPLDQLTRREGLMNLLNVVIKIPTIVKIDKYLREVLESFDFRNIDDMLVQSGIGVANAAEDAELAKGENIALTQGQNIEVVGNDDIHLQVHQELTQQLQQMDESFRANAIGHIQAHMQNKMMREQQMMAQMMAQQGGGMPPPGGPPNGQPSNQPAGPGGPQGPPPASNMGMGGPGAGAPNGPVQGPNMQ